MYGKVKDRCLIKNLLYIKFYFVIIHIIIYASVKLNFKRNFIQKKVLDLVKQHLFHQN